MHVKRTVVQASILEMGFVSRPCLIYKCFDRTFKSVKYNLGIFFFEIINQSACLLEIQIFSNKKRELNPKNSLILRKREKVLTDWHILNL